MRIENWAVVEPNPKQYEAPEARSLSLQGEVFGHPRFHDGEQVTTSSIIGKNKRGKVVTMSGSEYELGISNPTYENMHPNARNRILKNLSVV